MRRNGLHPHSELPPTNGQGPRLPRAFHSLHTLPQGASIIANMLIRQKCMYIEATNIDANSLATGLACNTLNLGDTERLAFLSNMPSFQAATVSSSAIMSFRGSAESLPQKKTRSTEARNWRKVESELGDQHCNHDTTKQASVLFEPEYSSILLSSQNGRRSNWPPHISRA